MEARSLLRRDESTTAARVDAADVMMQASGQHRTAKYNMSVAGRWWMVRISPMPTVAAAVGMFQKSYEPVV